MCRAQEICVKQEHMYRERQDPMRSDLNLPLPLDCSRSRQRDWNPKLKSCENLAGFEPTLSDGRFWEALMQNRPTRERFLKSRSLYLYRANSQEKSSHLMFSTGCVKTPLLRVKLLIKSDPTLPDECCEMAEETLCFQRSEPQSRPRILVDGVLPWSGGIYRKCINKHVSQANSEFWCYNIRQLMIIFLNVLPLVLGFCTSLFSRAHTHRTRVLISSCRYWWFTTQKNTWR